MPHALWLFSTAYRDVVATVLTVLTVLTALMLMARFSTAELILIVRVPARPSHHAKESLHATQPAGEGAGMSWPVRAFFEISSPGR